MNDTLQTALAWLGGLTAFVYVSFLVYLAATSTREQHRIDARRAALRASRAPLTEAEIEAVDFDAELANLTKENGR